MKGNNKIGLEKINKYGEKMKIIDVLNSWKVLVEFQDEFKAVVEMNWETFKKGGGDNPYRKINYGVGYLGEGKFKCKENGKIVKWYDLWSKMLLRCYCEKEKGKNSKYFGIISVCDEWHNYQNFAE